MHFIGVDLGTSGIKTILINELGTVIQSNTEEQSFKVPQNMWAEQDPESWWEKVSLSIRKIIALSGIAKDEIRCIGVTGQMVGLVVTDCHGKPLRPCIMWNDQRSALQARQITETVGFDRLIKITGNPAFASFIAPKIHWLRQNEPELYDRIRHIMLPKDFIVHQLTGAYSTDVTDASGTCLFDVSRRKWSSELLVLLDVPGEWIPQCLESDQLVGKLTAAAAQELGLNEHTLVCAGAGDQAAQALGCGIVKPGLCSMTIGTSGVVYTQTDRYLFHPQGILHAFCHSLPNQWALMGVMLSAGGAYQWLKMTLGTIAEGLSYQQMDQLAMAAKPGSSKLVFLPYLTGERCPYDDPYAKGCWIGLTATHQAADLVRSVLEGISFGLADLLSSVRSFDLLIHEVRVSGGAASSPYWMQMLADILGLPVLTTNVKDGGAFGAAMLAAKSCGYYQDLAEAASQIIRITRHFDPDIKNQAEYEDSRRIFRQGYTSLQKLFRSMADS